VFIKAVDQNTSNFLYIEQKFPKTSEAKIIEGIFVGSQIREMRDGRFLFKLK
jgi:hypothetical protein